MKSLLEVDVGHLGGSRSEDLVVDRSGREMEAFERFQGQLADGAYPISDPVVGSRADGEVRTLGEALAGTFDDVLVLGIGGSTLGFRALLQFLKGPYYNLFGRGPRAFVVDNADPTIAADLLAGLDLERTLLVYISKSGATPEPAANFLVFLEAYLRQGGSPSNVVIICDRADNGINGIASKLGAHKLEIPGRLPGRYSVLSSVGLLPSQLLGIEAAEILDGAARIHRSALELPAENNPCFRLGHALHAHSKRGKNIHFLLGYTNLLSELNLWFVQLWSESLGKLVNRDGEVVRTGTTPVTGIGATDQHSVLQLLREGPADKVIGFLRVDDLGQTVPIPGLFPEFGEYSYFEGHSLAEQLAVEQLSTEISLARTGHPCYLISLAERSPATIGALLYFWQLVVVYTAELENIDPFNQPGVEEGKQMTYALMGSEAYAATRSAQEARLSAHDGKRRWLSMS